MKNFEVKELLRGLPIVNYHAAGIDVGNKEMWVTYTNPEGCKCQFKSECFTKDLDEIVRIFLKEGVTDVAMESTGVYGGPLREKLETAGLRVTIINPRDYKRYGDKKDDAYDSMQIHLYHSIDFFRRSHFAPEHWRDLREYNHERDIVALQKATTLVRIQRLLTMMNVKFANVVSDIEGVGAMKVITAIAEGETDAEKLVALLNLKLFKKSSKEEITESLKGNYRSCLVYVLKEKLEEYKFFVSQMRKYETRIECILEEISILEETKRIADEKGTQNSEEPENPEEKNVRTSENKQKKKTKKTEKTKTPDSKRTTKARKNEYDFNGDYYLCRILGIDLTAVEGFSDKTLLTILSVTGTDMSQWPNAKAFVSWLCLCPSPKISGGKVIGYERKKTKNPATQAFRLCAQSLHNSKSPLGCLYRKLLVRKGPKTAIKAIARKLAILFYTLIKNSTEYSEFYFEVEKEKQNLRDKKNLLKLATKLGYDLIEKNSL